MPKLSPQRIDDRKWERAEAYVAAWNNWEKCIKEHGAISKQTTDAYRHLKYCERQYKKVRYQ